VLGPGSFLGEGCLAGESTRMRSAIAVKRSVIVVVGKDMMVHLLRRTPVSDCLLWHVLARHITMEQALIDQHFGTTEKRLARTLLMLARYGTNERLRPVVRNVSEATLATMTGTAPTQISAVLDQFE
jgi:CRP/FNR family cyclic AMP-dependent transcriptional regulator